MDTNVAACRLHELDASVCALRLPQAFHLLLPHLAAEQDGVRFGTQQALKNLINDCLDEGMINTGVSRGSMGAAAGAPTPAQGIVSAVANMLTARSQDAWTNALPGAHASVFSTSHETSSAWGHKLFHHVPCMRKLSALPCAS